MSTCSNKYSKLICVNKIYGCRFDSENHVYPKKSPETLNQLLSQIRDDEDEIWFSFK